MSACRHALIALILIDGLTFTQRRLEGRSTVIVNAAPRLPLGVDCRVRWTLRKSPLTLH